MPKHVDPSVNDLIRKLQPDAVINDRGCDNGGFGTPECDYQSDGARAFATRVEACQAVGSESWGYRSGEDHYTVGHLERSITRRGNSLYVPLRTVPVTDAVKLKPFDMLPR